MKTEIMSILGHKHDENGENVGNVEVEVPYDPDAELTNEQFFDLVAGTGIFDQIGLKDPMMVSNKQFMAGTRTDFPMDRDVILMDVGAGSNIEVQMWVSGGWNADDDEIMNVADITFSQKTQAQKDWESSLAAGSAAAKKAAGIK